MTLEEDRISFDNRGILAQDKQSKTKGSSLALEKDVSSKTHESSIIQPH
jgi:hypothetical protein